MNEKLIEKLILGKLGDERGEQVTASSVDGNGNGNDEALERDEDGGRRRDSGSGRDEDDGCGRHQKRGRGRGVGTRKPSPFGLRGDGGHRGQRV